MTIYAALLSGLSTLHVGSPALPIDLPEPIETFDPPDDRKYLTVNDARNALLWQGLSAGRIDQGILYVAVIWPKNKGLEGPDAHASEVIAHFQRRTFSAGGVNVKCGEPYRASAITEPSQVRIPVLIPWTA